MGPEEVIKIGVGAIVALILIYVGLNLIWSFFITLWDLNPLTGVGFIISIIIAFFTRQFSLDKGEENLITIVFIGVGTVISYAATSQIPTLLKFAFSGQLIGAMIMAVVIVILWFRGQEIKGGKFRK